MNTIRAFLACVPSAVFWRIVNNKLHHAVWKGSHCVSTYYWTRTPRGICRCAVQLKQYQYLLQMQLLSCVWSRSKIEKKLQETMKLVIVLVKTDEHLAPCVSQYQLLYNLILAKHWLHFLSTFCCWPWPACRRVWAKEVVLHRDPSLEPKPVLAGAVFECVSCEVEWLATAWLVFHPQICLSSYRSKYLPPAKIWTNSELW